MILVTTKKQATLIVLRNIGFAALALAISGLACYVIARRINAISKSLSDKKEVYIGLQQRAQTIDNAKSDLDYIGDGDKKLEAAFVSEEDISPFLGYIRGLAQQENFQQVLHFSQPKAFAVQSDISIDQTQYSTALVGPESKLINYLQALEKAPYVQRVDSITIAGPSDKGWNGPNASLNLISDLFVRQ